MPDPNSRPETPDPKLPIRSSSRRLEAMLSIPAPEALLQATAAPGSAGMGGPSRKKAGKGVTNFPGWTDALSG